MFSADIVSPLGCVVDARSRGRGGDLLVLGELGLQLGDLRVDRLLALARLARLAQLLRSGPRSTFGTAE